MRPRKLFFLAPLALVGFAAFIALGGAAVMWLWNWLVPELFNGPELTYWQTLGLFILSKILFSGIGGGGLQVVLRFSWRRA